jgi:hypothetical protein
MVAPMAPSCKSECLTSVGLPYAILFAGLGFRVWGLVLRGFSPRLASQMPFCLRV